VLTELRNRGVADVCIVVCDGLKGLPDAITTTWPLAVVQTCVLHLIRATFRLAGRQHWDAMARDLRPVYTAPTSRRPRSGSVSSSTPGATVTRR
jgi:transposase-like protein